MSYRAVLSLFLVAVALTVYVVAFERTAPGWERGGRLFPYLEPGDIIELRIERKNLESDRELGVDARPIVLRWEGSPPAWWLVEPIRFMAYHPRVQSFAYDLVDVASVAKVSPDKATSFDQAVEMVIGFKTRDGEAYTLEMLGDHPDPELQFSYCRLGQDTFAVPSELKKAMSVSLNDLRSRALVGISSTDATSLAIGGGERFAKLIQREGDTLLWRLEQPLAALADRELTEALLDGLNSWAIETFVTEEASGPAALAPYGLDEPRASVTVDAVDGRSVTVHIGNPLDEKGGDGEQVFVCHPDQPFVFSASSGPLESIFKEVEAFRSRYLFEVGLEEVDRLRGRLDETVIELRRKKGPSSGGKAGEERTEAASWEVRRIDTAAPAGEQAKDGGWIAADTTVLNSTLVQLRRLLILKFIDEPLEAVRGSVTVGITDGREINVQWGEASSAPEDEGQDVYQVAVPGEPGSFLVSTELPRLFSKGTAAFRRRNVSDVVGPQVLEVEIRDGDRSWVLGRVDSASWMLSQDTPLLEGKELSRFMVSRLIGLLSDEHFRVREFLPELKDYPAYQLELQAPRAAVSLLGFQEQPGPLFRKLLIGKPVEASHPPTFHARSNLADTPPFVVESDLAKAFTDLVAHLRDITGA